MTKPIKKTSAKNAVATLLELLPYLKVEYESDLEIFGSEYSRRFHSVYGQLLNPLLVQLLKDSDWSSNQELYLIFDLIESLSSSGDPEAEELVAVTICERLGDEKEILRRARQLMGPTTSKLSHEVEVGWGRE